MKSVVCLDFWEFKQFSAFCINAQCRMQFLATLKAESFLVCRLISAWCQAHTELLFFGHFFYFSVKRFGITKSFNVGKKIIKFGSFVYDWFKFHLCWNEMTLMPTSNMHCIHPFKPHCWENNTVSYHVKCFLQPVCAACRDFCANCGERVENSTERKLHWAFQFSQSAPAPHPLLLYIHPLCCC